MILLALLFAACSSIECPVQNTVNVYYLLNDTLKDTLTVRSARYNGTDTILYNSGVNTTKLSLPISYTNPVDTILFETKKLPVVDTLWIEKTNTPRFESVDCNPAYFHQITSVAYTCLGIDTIVIYNQEVNYDRSKPHLLIYFKARP